MTYNHELKALTPAQIELALELSSMATNPNYEGSRNPNNKKKYLSFDKREAPAVQELNGIPSADGYLPSLSERART